MRCCALLVLLCVAPAGAQPPKIDFLGDVQPIFESRCQGCHGAQQQMAGLRLDSGAVILKEASDGPVIQPGKSAASRLMERVTSTKKGFGMPPIGEPLTAGQIATLRAWIDQGAKLVRKPQAEMAEATTSHWSFRPVRRPATPDVRDESWVRNPIDRFILARLEPKKIAPAPEADRRTLVRRLSLDLLGLPPTPAEIEAFVADNGPGCLRPACRPASGIAAFWRALGPPLARPGPLCRQRRLREGFATAVCLALSQLGDRRNQPRPAVR